MNPEVLGLAASVLILLSIAVRGEKRIRQLNIVGSALFVIYGIIIHSYSIILLDACGVVINIYHLHKIKKEANK